MNDGAMKILGAMGNIDEKYISPMFSELPKGSFATRLGKAVATILTVLLVGGGIFITADIMTYNQARDYLLAQGIDITGMSRGDVRELYGNIKHEDEGLSEGLSEENIATQEEGTTLEEETTEIKPEIQIPDEFDYVVYQSALFDSPYYTPLGYMPYEYDEKTLTESEYGIWSDRSPYTQEVVEKKILNRLISLYPPSEKDFYGQNPQISSIDYSPKLMITQDNKYAIVCEVVYDVYVPNFGHTQELTIRCVICYETTPAKPPVPESVLNVFPTADEVITIPIFLENCEQFDHHLHIVFAEGVPIVGALTELSVDSAHIPSESFLKVEDSKSLSGPDEGMDEYDFYLNILLDEVRNLYSIPQYIPNPDIEGIYTGSYDTSKYVISSAQSIVRDHTDGMLRLRRGRNLARLNGDSDSSTNIYDAMKMLKEFREESELIEESVPIYTNGWEKITDYSDGLNYIFYVFAEGNLCYIISTMNMSISVPLLDENLCGERYTLHMCYYNNELVAECITEYIKEEKHYWVLKWMQIAELSAGDYFKGDAVYDPLESSRYMSVVNEALEALTDGMEMYGVVYDGEELIPVATKDGAFLYYNHETQMFE